MTDKEMQELDAWLATNVMGWEKPPKGMYWILKNREPSGYFQKGVKIASPVWHPTTNIAQAFEVVEKMENCLHLKEHGEEGKWCAMFCASMMDYEHADTPALAICLAAKKAWEAK